MSGRGEGRVAWLGAGRVALGAALAVLCAAPTPGDVGGCGKPAEELDARAFHEAIERVDCAACEGCGFTTATCDLACGGEALPTTFDVGCAPLVHDGEVCVRRLEATSCDDYRPIVADDQAGKGVSLRARPRPSECQFCPPRP